MKVFTTLAFAATAAASHALVFSDFTTAKFFGVDYSDGSVRKSKTLDYGVHSFFTVGGEKYQILSIKGFYIINEAPMSQFSVNPDSVRDLDKRRNRLGDWVPTSGWKKGGRGFLNEVVGFTHRGDGFTAGRGKEFRFTYLTPPATSMVGMKVDYTRVGGGFGPSGINTGYFGAESFAPVPEPGTMAALGLGAAALLRRRRSRKA